MMRSIRNFRTWGGLILLALGLAACSPVHRQATPMPDIAAGPVVPETTVRASGSLFNDADAGYLFSDNRARRVGDIVLINIVETTSGKNTADAKADKTSSLSLGVENFFDKTQQNVFGLKVPIGTTPAVKASASSAFEGTGEIERKSRVSATIGARVIRVLPNDILQVEGAREVRVGDETQIIVIQGLIRARDIGPDNSISSNYLANAKIDYYGTGILADKQKPGWLTRILDNLWPF